MPAPHDVAWVVEDGGGDSYYAGDSKRRAYRSATFTLTLGVLGSSVLPLPYAMRGTGVLVGLLLMALVAWVNAATSKMLIRAAVRTGHHTYEGLAEWAGGANGATWRGATTASLLLLLWGTLCGGLALLSDVAVVAADQAFPGGQAPEWLGPRELTTALVLIVLLPLCLLRHMRQLETAAAAGVALVLALVALLGAQAALAGFPGIVSGDVPLWTPLTAGRLPEAFSIISYAFFMQPMMMALLPEMPAGPVGVNALSRAVSTTLYLIAFGVYASMGLFGSALFGRNTQGNIMANHLVEGRAATLVLYGGMLVYLALGMTTTCYALRMSLDVLLLGEDAPFSRRRQVLLTTASIGSALVVALAAPGAAEKIIAVVGATGVCLVSYVIPVAITVTGHRRGWRDPGQDEARRAASRYMAWHGSGSAAVFNAPLLVNAADPSVDVVPGSIVRVASDTGGMAATTENSFADKGSSTAATTGLRSMLAQMLDAWEGIGEPMVVLVIGVGFSASALYVAIAALF